MNQIPRIALIAHDGKKPEMVSFVLQQRSLFEKAALYATGTTGSYIEKAGIKVEKMLSGPKGGDAQIASMVATGQLDLVFFSGTRSRNIPMNRMSKCSCASAMCIMCLWQRIRPGPG